MNTLPLDSAAEEQASLWAARLDGSTLSAEDRSALDSWLAANPAHRTLLSRYCQFSADLEQTLPALAAAGLVEMPTAEKPRRARRSFAWFIGGAFTAAAAAFAVWLAWPAAKVQSLAVPPGQRQTVVLDDGTRVELNARTSLQIENTRSERHVRLADGEAFFTVSKDPSRPFIVETPAGSVRVTGTVFDVRTEAVSQLEVTVVEGSVQVRPDRDGGTPHALGARDQLSADASGVTVKSLPAETIDHALAWREGKIFFEDVPLRDALARFARYHGRGLILSSAADAKSHTVGGLHNLDDLEDFLSGIEVAMPDLRVSHETNGTVRITLRDQP